MMQIALTLSLILHLCENIPFTTRAGRVYRPFKRDLEVPCSPGTELFFGIKVLSNYSLCKGSKIMGIHQDY